MKNTVLVCSYNRPMQESTRKILQELTRALPGDTRGAAYISQTGCADVALARNVALSGAMRAVRQLGDRDVVLMVDDDMLFTRAQAQALVDEARASQVPCAAMYATTMGTLAAVRVHVEGATEQRWLAGLGLLALPVKSLLILEEHSRTFKLQEEERHTEFTWSAVDDADGNWYSEDYTFCRRLGGVRLLPIGIGHLKTIPLYPDDTTIEAVAHGRWHELAGDPDPRALKDIVHPTMRSQREPVIPRIDEGPAK